jgi:hypothetical protein
LLLAVLTPSAEAINRPNTLPAKNARSAPYVLVGQLYFTSGNVDYIGSGTVVRPRSVLTAGHNVYDPDGGWSTDVEFRRSAYGASALTDVFATRLYVLGGYRQATNTYGPDSLRSFAYDAGGLIFGKALAGGAYESISSNPAYVGASYVRVAVGYGAEFHSGDYPLYVVPTTAFFPVFGSYWENRSMAVEGGMSGGPLYTRISSSAFVVSAIIVASSGPPEASGVRRVDAAITSFVSTYLP